MEKIKIAFTHPYRVEHNNVFNEFNLLTPKNDGVWNNLVHVRDVYDADWIIACDFISPDLDLKKINMEKVIFVQREPPWFQTPRSPRARLLAKHKYGYTLGNSYMFAGWSFPSTYKEMENFKRKKRTKKVCAIVTNKRMCPGHLQRLSFIKYFCNKFPNVLDVYGIGMDKEGIGQNYKGQSIFGDKAKLEWLQQYDYALCLENGQANGFFTEKINDAFMTHTVPIYWGAPDIKRYFPENSYYTIDINTSDSIKKLLQIISTPVEKDILKNLKISRNRIMQEYNWWASIERIINSINASNN